MVSSILTPNVYLILVLFGASFDQSGLLLGPGLVQRTVLCIRFKASFVFYATVPRKDKDSQVHN